MTRNFQNIRCTPSRETEKRFAPNSCSYSSTQRRAMQARKSPGKGSCIPLWEQSRRGDSCTGLVFSTKPCWTKSRPERNGVWNLQNSAGTHPREGPVYYEFGEEDRKGRHITRRPKGQNVCAFIAARNRTVQPEYIVTLGAMPFEWLTNEKIKLGGILSRP